jgi:hypothetical protein
MNDMGAMPPSSELCAVWEMEPPKESANIRPTKMAARNSVPVDKEFQKNLMMRPFPLFK